jgi:pimeloyl-ACP methyl ester carboxylesterase
MGAVLHGGFGSWLHRAVQSSVESGVEGWIADLVASYSPWGFDPASISLPVKVWQGQADRIVPFGHGRWLADTIPSAQAELREDDGHLTVVAQRIADVHAWLAQYP